MVPVEHISTLCKALSYLWEGKTFPHHESSDLARPCLCKMCGKVQGGTSRTRTGDYASVADDLLPGAL